MTVNPNMKFHKVKREQCKAAILIEGLSGNGKSGLALILGRALAGNWKDVFIIDTENRSIPLFEGLTSSTGEKFADFQVGDFTSDLGYKPTNYIGFRDAAIQEGAKVVISDSISHAWQYEGGILDLVTQKKKTSDRYKRDSYAAWGDDEIVTEKNKLFQILRDHRAHVICTVRVKEKMEYDKDENGKSTLTSLGEQQIMQADMKYEPDLVLSMINPGKSDGTPPRARVIKSRYAILTKDDIYDFTPEFCEQIRKYLEEGTSPEELLNQQHEEYSNGLNEYLQEHKNAIPIWKTLCKDAGYENAKAMEIPLHVLKELFVRLTMD